MIKVLGNTKTAEARTAIAPSGQHLPLLAVGFTGLLGSAFLRRRRTWMTGLLALAFLAGTAGLSGCGSGSAPLSTGTGTTGGGTTTTAPKGTYNIVFSASSFTNSSVAASANVTLVIQ